MKLRKLTIYNNVNHFKWCERRVPKEPKESQTSESKQKVVEDPVAIQTKSLIKGRLEKVFELLNELRIVTFNLRRYKHLMEQTRVDYRID